MLGLRLTPVRFSGLVGPSRPRLPVPNKAPHMVTVGRMNRTEMIVAFAEPKEPSLALESEEG